jgi:hypothetical protein
MYKHRKLAVQDCYSKSIKENNKIPAQKNITIYDQVHDTRDVVLLLYLHVSIKTLSCERTVCMLPFVFTV